MKHLVFVGGGHSHAIALKEWGKKKLAGVKVTLISNVKDAPYSGMLPGLIAGYYSYEATHINLEKLAQFAEIDLMIEEVINIDPEQRQVICQSGAIIKFDVLAIDIGITPQDTQIKGAKLYAIPAKPVPYLLEKWQEIINSCQENPSAPITINIIGAGAGGVELSLNMHQRLSRILAPEKLTINLIHRGSKILSHQNQRASNLLTHILKQKKINLYLETEIAEVQPQQVISKSGKKFNYNYTFLVTNAQPAVWLKNSQIITDQQGFIITKNTLQTINHPYIFATGDIANIHNFPCPKAGVFAVKQGKPLFKNILNYLSDQPLINYIPQQKYLNIIGTGEKNAVAIWDGIICRSPLLWNLKEWLDFNFMNQFKF